MFLSRLELHLLDRRNQRLLHDPYRMHKSLLWAFPSDQPGGDPRLLFRVEVETGGNPTAIVLVQSETCPNWEDRRFLAVMPVLTSLVKPLELALVEGMRVHFRLRANPTVKRNGRRLGLSGPDPQRDWVIRKLNAGGLEVQSVDVLDEGNRICKRSLADDEQTMTFLSVRADGVAKVIEPARVWSAVRTGIGPAKAFGFGLISLARG